MRGDGAQRIQGAVALAGDTDGKRRGGYLHRGALGQRRGGGLESGCELSAQLETNFSNFTNGRWDAGRATGWPSPPLIAIDRT